MGTGGTAAARQSGGSGPLRGRQPALSRGVAVDHEHRRTLARSPPPPSGTGTRPVERRRSQVSSPHFGPGWIGFLRCSIRVRTCGACVDRMEQSQICHETPEFLTRGAEWRQFMQVFRRFRNVLDKSGGCVPCILMRCAICAPRDARLASRVTALLGRFLPKLRAALRGGLFLSYEQVTSAVRRGDSVRHYEMVRCSCVGFKLPWTAHARCPIQL